MPLFRFRRAVAMRSVHRRAWHVLFVLLLAYLFPIAAEKRSWRVVVGAVLIVLGVVLLSR